MQFIARKLEQVGKFVPYARGVMIPISTKSKNLIFEAIWDDAAYNESVLLGEVDAAVYEYPRVINVLDKVDWPVLNRLYVALRLKFLGVKNG